MPSQLMSPRIQLGVLVAVRVLVAVLVAVGVAVRVAVAVGVLVLVGVAVGVAVGQGPTVVLAVPVLLAGFGSGVVLVAVSEFTMTVQTGVPGFTRTTRIR